MLTKPIALVGLAAVMLAAGAGSYVAVRQNAAPIHQGDGTDATSIAQPAVITDAAEGRVVEATEATVEHGGRSGADDAEAGDVGCDARLDIARARRRRGYRYR